MATTTDTRRETISLIGSDKVEGTAVYGGDSKKIGKIERVMIDKISGKVLSIYRNWDELDEAREELQWFVEFPFIPWRGAYPIGLVHMIGGISAATTGALRALMDSAHINNSQTMLKLKGGSKGGQSLNVQDRKSVV